MKYLWAHGACLLVLALLAARSASAMPFHRGDVFINGRGGIEEYSPEGTPVQLIEANSTGDGFCFDPSGNYLIVPGVGLFDKQGRMLESNWASDKSGKDCVVDGSNNVLVTTQIGLTKYDIHGNALQSFSMRGGAGFGIALAPDGCTIYDGGWVDPGIERFNVCTNTQEPIFASNSYNATMVDELRVLPNWEVLSLTDGGAALFDVSGQIVRTYYPPIGPYGYRIGSNGYRSMSLDPDGRSFWMCCGWAEPPGEAPPLFRFDINSGEVLAQWKPIDGRGPIAVYSPENNGRGAG